MAEDRTVYVQPSVRQTMTWTPALLRSALTSADGGYLRQVASLCDALLGDERVRTDFQTRVGTLLGLPLGFEEGTDIGGRTKRDGDDRGEQVIALDDGRDWWRIAPEPQSMQVLMWGLLLGVCPARLVVPDKPDEKTGRLVPTIEFWHPQHLRQDQDTKAWWIKVGQYGDQEVGLVPGEDGWLLFAPYGLDRPWSMGLWRGLSRWWLLKSYSIDDSGRHSETASRTVAKDLNSKSSKEQRRALVSDIQSLGRDGIIVLPPGLDLSLVESKADFDKLYGALQRAANTAITISVRGANLGTEVSGGSFAAAQSHLEVDHKRLRFDAETFSTFSHDQVLSHWAEWNWGDPALAPWPSWDTEPPADEKQRADTIGSVTRSLQVMLDLALPVDPVALLTEFGVPLDEAQAKVKTIYGRVFQYHLTFGVLTKNQILARLRLPPVPGGEAPPEPMEAAATAGQPVNRLASGFMPQLASGFVDGQTYADALAEQGQAHGADGLEDFIAELLAVIDGVEDLDEAQQRLIDFYDGAEPPADIADMAAKLFVMAELGGRAAVAQDAPEAKESK